MPISANSPKFSHFDYVNPISLDFFTDVVSKKQQMYDEGRSLVQKQLDTYDSFVDQMSRPQDKAYAEQELTKLTDAINQNAGLDFSNRANLQAVLNIGKPLEKDQTIVQSIRSEQIRLKNLEDLKKLDPNLRAPENDARFFKHMNEWYNNPTPGAVLTDEPYKPYQKGIVDKWGQMNDKLKPTTETVISQTPDGRWITTSKISSVDAGRFHDAYMGALTPAEKEQLAISAEYRMNQVGKDAVAKDYLLNQTSTYKGLENQIKQNEAKYESAKAQHPETDPDMLQFKASIDNLKMQRDVLAKKIMVRPEEINEGVLINHLINEDIMNTAGSLAYKQVETKMDHNPYALEGFKTQNNLLEYDKKKQMDLFYAAEADRLGLDISGTGSQKSNGLIGYTPMDATDEKALKDLGKYNPNSETPLGHVQNFKDLSSLSGAENLAIHKGIIALSGYKLSPSDKNSLVEVGTIDPKTKQFIPGATVQDMLDVAENEQSLGHNRVSRIFGGANQAKNKEKFLWKLKGIAAAMAKAKNTPGVNVTYTAADKSGKNIKRTIPVQQFLEEPAGAVFSNINDLYLESEN